MEWALSASLTSLLRSQRVRILSPLSLSLATLCSLLTHATRRRRQPQPNAFHVFKRRVLCTPPSLRGAIQSGTCAYLARRGEGQKADDSDDDRCDSSISNYAAAAAAPPRERKERGSVHEMLDGWLHASCFLRKSISVCPQPAHGSFTPVSCSALLFSAGVLHLH